MFGRALHVVAVAQCSYSELKSFVFIFSFRNKKKNWLVGDFYVFEAGGLGLSFPLWDYNKTWQ